MDINLRQAQEIIEELVKPVVCTFNIFLLVIFLRGHIALKFSQESETSLVDKIYSIRQLDVFPHNMLCILFAG